LQLDTANIEKHFLLLRSKDQLSPSPKSFPYPNLHDDEMADSDEELPPAFLSAHDSKCE
jgi:hypothetical protein